MYVAVLLVSVCCALAGVGVEGSGLSTCVRNYEKVGCYDEYHANVKDLVVYDRYGIKWADIVGYMHHLACTCESKLREVNKGRTLPEQYVGFALHFWGECYGRTQAQMNSLASKSKSERCTGDQTYTKCFDKDPECTGHAFSEFVYKIKENVLTVRGCDFNGVNISCHQGTIKLQSVVYGKRTPSVCGAPLSEGWNDSCQKFSTDSFSAFMSHCLGRTTCFIPDWTKDPEDPCPAVKKSIVISYICKI